METQKLTWRHIGVVATTMAMLGTAGAIGFSCAGLCYKPVANYLGVQVSDVSIYMTILYIAQILFSPIAEKLLRYLDPRIVGIGAAIFLGGGIGMMATYNELWQWYVSGAFMGCGMIVLFWLLPTGILGRWYKKDLGVTLGFTYCMTGVGGAIFNIIGQTILGPSALTVETWRDLYLFYGIAMVVINIPMILLFVRRDPEEVGLKAYGAHLNGEVVDEKAPKLIGFEPASVFKKWYFWVLVFAGGLMNMFAIYPQHFTTFYQTVVACNPDGSQIPELMAMSGTLEAFTMVGMAIGKIITGAIESKSIHLTLIVGVITGICAAAGILLGGLNRILPLMFGAGLLYGFIYSWCSVLLPYLVRNLWGDLHYEKIFQVATIPVNLVGAFVASGLAIMNEAFGWTFFFIFMGVAIVVTWLMTTIAFKLGTRDYTAAFGPREETTKVES